MNNARRILSKGSTLLRGCWFWSKKLHFQKNFGRNFIAVEGVNPPPPGGILWMDPKSSTRRKRTPPEEQPPKLIWGSLGFVGLKPPNHPTSLGYPLSIFWGGDFLQSNYIFWKRKIQNYRRKVLDEDFPEKNVFLPGVSAKKERKKERKKSPCYFFLKSQHDKFQSQTAHHSFLTVSRPPSPSGLRCRVAVYSCQENKRSLVKIHPQWKKDRTSGQGNKSDPREKYMCKPVRKPR